MSLDAFPTLSMRIVYEQKMIGAWLLMMIVLYRPNLQDSKTEDETSLLATGIPYYGLFQPVKIFVGYMLVML